MNRITQAQLTNAYLRFLKATGKRGATSHHDVGGYVLDCNPAYGGYKIGEICNENGGQNEPFGCLRRSRRSMYDVLQFATRAIEEKERGMSF